MVGPRPFPFEAGTFDAVTCQFGLMFFEDRVKALEEMQRVLRPSGRAAIAVWDQLSETPGYAAMATILERLFGKQVASELQAPFCLGDKTHLMGLLREASIRDATVRTVAGQANFASLDAWLTTDIRGWTLADVIDDDQFERLRQEAQELVQFVQEDGSVSFDSPAHIITFES